MENRFENIPPEEKLGWGAYATPPPIPGHKPAAEQLNTRPVLPQDLSMCDRVRDKLPNLMENSDGEMSADTVRALYGHLSVCASCSKDFDDQQRIAQYLDAIPMVQMPMDFTGAIQRRIQIQTISPQTQAVVSPATSRAFGTPASSTQNSSSAAIGKRSLTSGAAVISTLKKTKTSTTLQISQIESGLMRRFTSGGITSAIMASFVSSAWGREMLVQNITAVRAWLDQIAAAFGRIPVFGRLALLAFTALAQAAICSAIPIAR